MTIVTHPGVSIDGSSTRPGAQWCGVVTHGDYTWKIERPGQKGNALPERPDEIVLSREVPPGSSLLSDLGQLAITEVYKRYISRDYNAEAASGCRFTPSCSLYMRDALKEYGFLAGIKIGLMRLSRCAPGMPGGLDPVPLKDGTYPGGASPEHLRVVAPPVEAILSNDYEYALYRRHVSLLKRSAIAANRALHQVVQALNDPTAVRSRLNQEMKGFSGHSKVLWKCLEKAEKEMENFPTKLDPSLDFDHLHHLRQGALFFREMGEMIDRFYATEGENGDIRELTGVTGPLKEIVKLQERQGDSTASAQRDNPGLIPQVLLKTIPPAAGFLADLDSRITGALIGCMVGAVSGAYMGYRAGTGTLGSFNEQVISDYSPASLANLSLYEHQWGSIPYRVNSFIQEHTRSSSLATLLGGLAGLTISPVIGAFSMASILAPMLGGMTRHAVRNFVREAIGGRRYTPLEGRSSEPAPEKDWSIVLFQARGTGLSKRFREELEKLEKGKSLSNAHIQVHTDVNGSIEDQVLGDEGLSTVRREEGDLLSRESIRECLLDHLARYPAKRHVLVFSCHHGRLAESLPALNEALGEVKEATGVSPDAVILDSCKSAAVEAAWPLRNAARFIVASQDVVRSERPFVEVLDALSHETPAIEGFLEKLVTTRPDVSFSIISTERLPGLMEKIKRLASEIVRVRDRNHLKILRDLVQQSQHFLVKEFSGRRIFPGDEVDLADCTDRLSRNTMVVSAYPALAEVCQEIHSLLTESPDSPVALSCVLQNRVRERDGYRCVDLKDAHGISLTVPTKRRLTGKSPFHIRDSIFYQESGWDGAIHHLKKGLNPFRFASAMTGSVFSSCLQAADNALEMLFEFSPAMYRVASMLLPKVTGPAPA